MLVIAGTTQGRAPLSAGVELGGTKCVCTLAQGPDHIVEQIVVPTRSPATTLGELRTILERWHKEHAFDALGIASFGPVDVQPASQTYGSILATNKPGWSMTDVLHSLSAGFDVFIAFDTDVNGAATAEMLWGSGKGLSDFAYITVGTGVGAGLIVRGVPARGFAHSELGHLRLPPLPGGKAASACNFHDDCIEGLASGTAIRLAIGDRDIASIPEDDPLWDRIVMALGVMCHALVCTAAPQRIAIGGGVMVKQPHLLPRIEPELRRSLNGYIALPCDDYILAPVLGEQAGPMGPIALALLELEKANSGAENRLRVANS